MKNKDTVNGFEIQQCPVHKHYEIWYGDKICAYGYMYGEMYKIREQLIKDNS